MALRLLAEANLAFGISITDLDEFLPEAQKVADRWADRLWYHLG